MDVNVRNECYQVFIAKYGDEHAKTLLVNHRRLKLILRTQTYGERKSEFKKASSKLLELVSIFLLVLNATDVLALQMNSYESMHGFSGIFALLGNNTNSDNGMAVVHETKDATGVSTCGSSTACSV